MNAVSSFAARTSSSSPRVSGPIGDADHIVTAALESLRHPFTVLSETSRSAERPPIRIPMRLFVIMAPQDSNFRARR